MCEGRAITAQEVMGMSAVPCGQCLDEGDGSCPHCGGSGECENTRCECWIDAAVALAEITDGWEG